MSFTDTKVQLSDGANLRVRVSGITEQQKPLLIALHGAPGLSSHTEPESAYSFLADKFRVLVYDARGSGLSDMKGPFTDERWVADVDELRYGTARLNSTEAS
jgi:proline iminopeptidase